MDSIKELDPKLERSFRGHKKRVNSVSFHPSGEQLASGSADHMVMVWNFKPSLRRFKFAGHKVECIRPFPFTNSLSRFEFDGTYNSMNEWHRVFLSVFVFIPNLSSGLRGIGLLFAFGSFDRIRFKGLYSSGLDIIGNGRFTFNQKASRNSPCCGIQCGLNVVALVLWR